MGCAESIKHLSRGRDLELQYKNPIPIFNTSIPLSPNQ